MLKPGHTVRVVRTMSIAFDVDIRGYLEDSGYAGISYSDLESDIEDNIELSDILDNYDNVEVTGISTKITELF